MVQIQASSEEEAINILRHKMENQVENLHIDNIRVVTTLPEGTTAEDFNPNKTVN